MELVGTVLSCDRLDRGVGFETKIKFTSVASFI